MGYKQNVYNDCGELCPLCQSPVLMETPKPMRSTKDILASLTHFRDKKQEYLVSLSLNSGQRLIARRIVTIGLLDTSLAHPREIFAGPLTDRAASVIIAHNHPSGVAAPSGNDVALTQQLAAAGQLLGIPLQDHVIITSSGYFSFRGRGLL
jgi:DNA repair protein RadC